MTSSPKGRESQEQQVTIARLEESCARCEERAEVAEKTAEEKVQYIDKPHVRPFIARAYGVISIYDVELINLSFDVPVWLQRVVSLSSSLAVSIFVSRIEVVLALALTEPRLVPACLATPLLCCRRHVVAVRCLWPRVSVTFSALERGQRHSRRV